jgi:hypothetical protein
MSELTVPQVDFSGLGQLPQIYQQGHQQRQRQMALANLGQGDSTDANTLLRSGDLSLAQLGLNLRNRQEDQARQAQLDARQAARDKIADQHWQASFGLQQRSADRADQTPVDKANERATVAKQYGIDPSSPEGRQFIVTGQMPQTALDTATQRAGVARQYGIDPQSAEGRAFILNGKLPDTTPPENYEVNPDFGKVEGAPKIRPVSGGPADPATIAADAEAKQGSGMSDGAVDILARRVASGDTTALTNVGRGAQGSKNIERIQNRAAQLLQQEEGLSPQDAAKRVIGNIQSVKASQVGQSAEARTGATREANLNLILKATDAAIPAALEASDKVARTGWVPINKIIQGGEVVASNPDLKRFGMANLQLAEHWARAMNPTGVMRESDRDKALGFLSTADSPQTYRAAVDQLRTQITRERDAVRGSIPETSQFKGGTAPNATSPHPDPLGIR